MYLKLGFSVMGVFHRWCGSVLISFTCSSSQSGFMHVMGLHSRGVSAWVCVCVFGAVSWQGVERVLLFVAWDAMLIGPNQCSVGALMAGR